MLDDAEWIILRRVHSDLALSDEKVDARWKSDVRNVLQRRKSTGEVLWDGRAGYRLTRR